LDTDSAYLELVIVAESTSTEIWLGDSDGHFVQKGVGLLRSRLLPSDYVVEFGLGSATHPISLTEKSCYTDACMRDGTRQAGFTFFRGG